MDIRDHHTQPFHEDPLGFLSYGGEMTERMRDFNWAASPLGPPQYWPQSLRSLVALILNSEFAMFLAWGPSLTFLYNDRYSEIIEDKHPRALGRPMRESWPEISAEIGPLIEKALAGHASFSKNLPFKLNRKGVEEDAFFTFSYSPVRDESEQIRQEAVDSARYLAEVVGKAHARQMDANTRKAFGASFKTRRSSALDAPSWLWSSVVELASAHEAAYLEHCRKYALA